MLAICELTVSQERGFGSNHLARYGTVGVADLRLHTLQYTRLLISLGTEVKP